MVCVGKRFRAGDGYGKCCEARLDSAELLQPILELPPDLTPHTSFPKGKSLRTRAVQWKRIPLRRWLK